jgi:hypothetical protein
MPLVADRAHLQAIIAGRQAVDAIVTRIVGQHAHGDLGLEVARLYEGAAERFAVRPGDCAGDRRCICQNRRGSHGADPEGNSRQFTHRVFLLFLLCWFFDLILCGDVIQSDSFAPSVYDADFAKVSSGLAKTRKSQAQGRKCHDAHNSDLVRDRLLWFAHP